MNAPNLPKIRKAHKITGKTLVFRDATTADATFILTLRTDPKKSTHLSYTPPTLTQQMTWLETYAQKGDQAYFIIENKLGEALGTVRLYDPQNESFCWGSWILKDGAPQTAAIESALMVYAYAIDHLGFSQAHFDVRKENESVWRFHERFGAQRVAITELDYFYTIDCAAILQTQKTYAKFLPDNILVFA